MYYLHMHYLFANNWQLDNSQYAGVMLLQHMDSRYHNKQKLTSVLVFSSNKSKKNMDSLVKIGS